MSSLTLVRHAQASFFADEYDRLSAVGERQAAFLGQFWLSRQWIPSEVYVGPRQRHEQTAAAIAGVFRQAGFTFPDLVVMGELDEYDLSGVLHCLAPNLARENNDFARLFQRQRHGPTSDDQARNFQRMFEPLMLHWMETGESCDGVETWPAFRSRVERGLKRMTDSTDRGRRVVAFTSGGFIGTAVQLVLGAPDRMALEVNWRIRNAALTEFVFNAERISLDVFNSIAHLADPAMVTYR